MGTTSPQPTLATCIHILLLVILVNKLSLLYVNGLLSWSRGSGHGISEEKWVRVGFVPMSIRIRAGPVNFFPQPSCCSLRSAPALPEVPCRSTSVVLKQWLLSVHGNCVAVSL